MEITGKDLVAFLFGCGVYYASFKNLADGQDVTRLGFTGAKYVYAVNPNGQVVYGRMKSTNDMLIWGLIGLVAGKMLS